MNTVLIKALQLILSLSILVVLHEGGHFFFSKLFKVKVEKFFMFLMQVVRLFIFIIWLASVLVLIVWKVMKSNSI